MKILRVVLLVSLTLAVSVAKSDQGESLRGKVDDGTSALNADVVDLLNRNLKKEDDDGKETGGGGDKGPKKDQQKVKICHGTASPTNPYVIIEVADDAASDNPGSLGGHINNPKHNDPSKNKNSDVLMGADTPDFPGCKTNDRCQVCCPDQKCYGDGDKPEPKPTEPQPTEPEPTEPEPTEPKPTEPGPTKPSDPSPTKPSVSGDPHFAMFGTSHRKYDFHGACDLVFLDNPDYNNGQGMKIHIRTKIVKWWSYVEQVVVQIGNDTLEVMGGVEQKSSSSRFSLRMARRLF
ncbi:expressed unknown protein [Seminavis robusta]|uniref:Uncharacterized protein n=1 Tax=Seminavis robusta TaxID=568900 RepID=A0A9N8HVW2_9STRA|nr:expressed unknown protein [Seminavis robusta]|eukprot:Sro1879_g303160.1 n/a (291) ;mRNA; r:15389-16749